MSTYYSKYGNKFPNLPDKDLALYGKIYPFLLEKQKKSNDCGCKGPSKVEEKGGCGCKEKSGLENPSKRIFHFSGFEFSKIISMIPAHSQGYLVLNNKENPEVVNWKINIIQQFGTKEVIVEQLTLSKEKNYWKVPKQYLGTKGLYLIGVTGFNILGEIIAIQTPFRISKRVTTIHQKTNQGWVEPKPLGRWICNGQIYAWELNLYYNENTDSGQYNGYYLYLDDAVSDEGFSFYEYAYVNEWNQSIMVYPEGNLWFSVVSTLNNPYYDEEGNLLLSSVGPVIAIVKTMGLWNGGPKNNETPIPENINGTIEEEITVFNNFVIDPYNIYAIPQNQGQYVYDNNLSPPQLVWRTIAELNNADYTFNSIHDQIPQLECRLGFGGLGDASGEGGNELTYCMNLLNTATIHFSGRNLTKKPVRPIQNDYDSTDSYQIALEDYNIQMSYWDIQNESPNDFNELQIEQYVEQISECYCRVNPGAIGCSGGQPNRIFDHPVSEIIIRNLSTPSEGGLPIGGFNINYQEVTKKTNAGISFLQAIKEAGVKPFKSGLYVIGVIFKGRAYHHKIFEIRSN